MKTLYVNLYGAPGSGKSTGASWVFSKLKLMGIDCEYVQEFAKDLVWENNRCVFDDPDNQLMIFANQFYRLNRIREKVRVAVVDSPLPLCLFYLEDSLLNHESYRSLVLRMDRKFDGINFLINRKKPYNQNGRNHTEDESNKLAENIRRSLDEWNVSYYSVNGDESGYDQIVSKVVNRLNLKNEEFG